MMQRRKIRKKWRFHSNGSCVASSCSFSALVPLILAWETFSGETSTSDTNATTSLSVFDIEFCNFQLEASQLNCRLTRHSVIFIIVHTSQLSHDRETTWWYVDSHLDDFMIGKKTFHRLFSHHQGNFNGSSRSSERSDTSMRDIFVLKETRRKEENMWINHLVRWMRWTRCLTWS